ARAAKGASLRWDVDEADVHSPAASYTVDSRVADLTITAADGKPAEADGIALVAAWSVHLQNVQVIGLTGSGLVCPWRGPDDDPDGDPADLFPGLGGGVDRRLLGR